MNKRSCTNHPENFSFVCFWKVYTKKLEEKHYNQNPVPIRPAGQDKDASSDEDDQEDVTFEPNTKEPHLLNQGDLLDLVRDLSLSKSNAELFGSRLQQWNLLELATKISLYINVTETWLNSLQ